MRLLNIRMMRVTRWPLAVMAISLGGFFVSSEKVAGDDLFRLSGHLVSQKMRRDGYRGRKPADERMKLAIVLRPSDQAGLDDFLKRVQDPSDPLFHRFLSTQEFAERFGPASGDVQAMLEHLRRNGVSIARVHSNRLVVDLEGSTAEIESAFQVQIHNYQQANGRLVHAANNNPALPADFAAKIQVVAGLDNFVLRKTHLRPGLMLTDSVVAPRGSVDDYMTPAKIKSAYNLNSVAATGSGETLAIFALAGYTASDITAYAARFGIPAPVLQNVLVDGANGSAGAGAEETTLDIELAAAMAPGLAKIIVYEGLNTDAGVLDAYSKIASDNAAAVVSTSWGATEDGQAAAYLNGENTIFQQMAAQGQSVFAASGDSGAFDDGNNPNSLSVDDPAAQPYVTSVGGTKLSLTAGNLYSSESAWGNGNDGGGGGVSKIWGIPAWQNSVGTNANGESTTHRMVPDVSLDADPRTGYSIYFGGSWYAYGGTSCGAPLWAGFAALVNQKRMTDGLGRLGFANPALYQVAQSAQYPSAFNDIGDYSNNLYFPAVPDYDLATGWGSFNGAGLYTNLTSAVLPAVLPAPSIPANLTVKANN